MAEAAVEQTSPTHKYFCHQCSQEITPNIQDFTCPSCNSGFIEEITEQFEEEHQHDHESSPETDPAAQFVELWGRTFLESIRQHAENTAATSRSTDRTGDVDNMETEDNADPMGIRVFTRAAPQIRFSRIGGSRNAGERGHGGIENVIQQIFSNIGRVPVLSMYGNPGDYAWGGELDNIITQLLNQLEGSGPPPAKEEEIEQLPTVKIEEEHVAKTAQCSVCMEDFKLNEEVKQLPCKHLFHTDCIQPWLKLHGTCPICRKNLQGKDTTEDEPTPPSDLPSTSIDPIEDNEFD